ncbi:TRAP transporter small permease [Halomonas sp. McH1-25]|uniref:TRAP transporter small permease n=1 Tax=unclassified Halomonas TaxID=2609666 RepID=UPI001EF7014A|nr:MULTISPECIES: TRAP transporter small permease [unclassified Halomonas]MCG7602233.1 TRAP transporter small permease [Halomonas sp. McH1-25]MCP1344588.1 TRAP transporter small permease [Halomonas sp. FL8]MCP1362862.1 TRAP transporter small permease [Halomonas sp. BBD45]MCP1363738.1 TRAP transporter small permease [Halomonas sp. BBD48]
MEKITHMVNKLLLGIAGLSLLLIVVVVTTNIVLRQVASSFGGVTEIVGWLTAVIVALSLAYSQQTKAHVELDLLVGAFPEKAQEVIQVLLTVVSLLFFTLVAWRLWEYGYAAMTRESLSQTLRVAYFPVVYLVALGFTAFCLVLLVDLVTDIKKAFAI